MTGWLVFIGGAFVRQAIADDRLRPGPPPAPCRGPIRHVSDRPGHGRPHAINASKSRREPGWRPRMGVEQGLQQTARWYQENREWIDRIGSGANLRQRLSNGAGGEA